MPVVHVLSILHLLGSGQVSIAGFPPIWTPAIIDLRPNGDGTAFDAGVVVPSPCLVASAIVEGWPAGVAEEPDAVAVQLVVRRRGDDCPDRPARAAFTQDRMFLSGKSRLVVLVVLDGEVKGRAETALDGDGLPPGRRRTGHRFRYVGHRCAAPPVGACAGCRVTCETGQSAVCRAGTERCADRGCWCTALAACSCDGAPSAEPEPPPPGR